MSLFTAGEARKGRDLSRPRPECGRAGAEPRPLTSWSRILTSKSQREEGETWGTGKEAE